MGESRQDPAARRSAGTFDEVFAEIAVAPQTLALFDEVLGPFPPGVEPFSLVTRAGLEEVMAELRLGSGERLLDLCCGRGGIGLWFARETGSLLTGVDWSPVAIAEASLRESRFLDEGNAEWLVADAARTPLPDGRFHAVVCIDALQLVPDQPALVREVARLLRPGGRLVLTTWERIGAEPSRLPGDVSALVLAAGLTLLTREERPEWTERQCLLYERAIAADGEEAEPALRRLAQEGRGFLSQRGGVRRLLLTAARPG